MRSGSFRSFSRCRLVAPLAFLALIGFTTAAPAGELHFILNGKAIHLDDAPDGTRFNENNWGAGLQYEFAPVAEGKWVPFWTAAGFNDSNRNPSYYAGGGLLRRFKPRGSPVHFDLGFVGFLMTREDYKNNNPFPGVLPVFSVGTEAVALNITYVPDIDPKSVPLVFFQLKFRLTSL